MREPRRNYGPNTTTPKRRHNKGNPSQYTEEGMLRDGALKEIRLVPDTQKTEKLMFAVVDMDCTLYSYLELALSQRGFAFSLFRDALSGDPRPLYDSADRVFDRHARRLGERAQFLIRFFGRENLLFYSSYPLTRAKKSFFSSFDVKHSSSFPLPKTATEIKKIHKGPVDLVIGDRKEDRKLARQLNSLWRGYPYYNFHHLLSGSSYTRAFISLVSEGLNPNGGTQ